METLLKYLLPGILLLLTLSFGLWVSHLGKPYDGLLFNIHKLIALGMVIVVIVRLSAVFKNVDPLLPVIVLLILGITCIVALFASGALLSAGKLDYKTMRLVHRIAPVVLVIDMGLVVYFLEG